MTWKDIKIITLQKMFAIDGNTLISDDTTEPYIKSMPGAANEGLMLLSTAGRYILKSVIVNKTENGVLRCDMADSTDDFYSFASRVYVLNDNSYEEYAAYSVEGESIIVFPAGVTGVFTVYYNAYPHEITDSTPDSADIGLAAEVAVLLPLYMASQLYKDDDLTQAVQMRNEFEAARELLIKNSAKRKSGAERIINTTYWW